MKISLTGAKHRAQKAKKYEDTLKQIKEKVEKEGHWLVFHQPLILGASVPIEEKTAAKRLAWGRKVQAIEYSHTLRGIQISAAAAQKRGLEPIAQTYSQYGEIATRTDLQGEKEVEEYRDYRLKRASETARQKKAHSLQLFEKEPNYRLDSSAPNPLRLKVHNFRLSSFEAAERLQKEQSLWACFQNMSRYAEAQIMGDRKGMKQATKVARFKPGNDLKHIL